MADTASPIDLISLIKQIGAQALGGGGAPSGAPQNAPAQGGTTLQSLLAGLTTNNDPKSMLTQAPQPAAYKPNSGDWRDKANAVTNTLDSMPYVMDPSKLTNDPAGNFNYMYAPGLQNSKQGNTIANYLQNLFGGSDGTNLWAKAYAVTGATGSGSSNSATTGPNGMRIDPATGLPIDAAGNVRNVDPSDFSLTQAYQDMLRQRQSAD